MRRKKLAETDRERIPKKHLGRISSEMERRGQRTIRGQYNENVDAFHKVQSEIRELEKRLIDSRKKSAHGPSDDLAEAPARTVDSERSPQPAPLILANPAASSSRQNDEGILRPTLQSNDLEADLKIAAEAANEKSFQSMRRVDLDPVENPSPLDSNSLADDLAEAAGSADRVEKNSVTTTGDSERSLPAQALVMAGSAAAAPRRIDEEVSRSALQPNDLDDDLKIAAQAASKKLCQPTPEVDLEPWQNPSFLISNSLEDDLREATTNAGRTKQQFTNHRLDTEPPTHAETLAAKNSAAATSHNDEHDWPSILQQNDLDDDRAIAAQAANMEPLSTRQTTDLELPENYSAIDSNSLEDDLAEAARSTRQAPSLA